jgi:putative ABC transport system permease protein
MFPNMKFLPLILRNVFRNKRRTILTILSIGVSLFLISTLRTMLASLESPPMTPESAKRLVTRHQTSLTNPLPIAYRNRIQTVPGVDQVTATQWFGGEYKDPSNFFAQFAVDADHFFDVYSEAKVQSPDQAEAFMKERTASLAGVKLAKRFGWNVGDRITLKGMIFPFDVETTIRGLVDGGGSEVSFYFHYDYFNELMKNEGIASTFAVKAKSADDLPAISAAIDDMFRNSTAPTKTEVESAFILGFAAMWGDVRTLVVSISTIVLFTIILVAANTMAMSIRERTGEIAILKTLGFSPGTVLGMVILESLVIAVAGGLGGSLGARLIFGAVDMQMLTGGFLQNFTIAWSTVLLSLGIALIVAITSTAFPAWNASRLPIAEAVRRRGE